MAAEFPIVRRLSMGGFVAVISPWRVGFVVSGRTAAVGRLRRSENVINVSVAATLPIKCSSS